MAEHRIHLRLTPAEAIALDRVADDHRTSRSRLIREGIELRLNLEAQVQAIRDAAHEAVEAIRQEVARGVQTMATASAAADATNRQLIATFLDALTDGAPSTPSAPASLPRRRDLD